MPSTEYMQCMEVWGGNQAVDSGVVMAGLDAWAFSKPCGECASGGDVHYVSSCASGRIARMLVADVAGHGDSVSEIAVRLRQLMRRFVNHLDQRRFVQALNHEFKSLCAEGRFATAVACTFFSPTGHLTISNAGHPPPLLYRARKRSWHLIVPQNADAATPLEQENPCADNSPSNLPLGVLDASQYDAISLRLATGDLVICYSDALIECRGSDGRLLGARGLLDMVRRLDAAEPQQFIPDLLRSIQSLAAGNLEGDDLTLLLFRPNGIGRRFSIRERFGTYGRVGAAAMRAITFRERFPWPDLVLANVGGAVIRRLSGRWRGEKAPLEFDER